MSSPPHLRPDTGLRCRIGDLTLEVPAGWYEITEPGEPITLAQNDGSGVLQFSVALYTGGKLPEFTASQLLELLLKNPDVSLPFDIVTRDLPPMAACTFLVEDGDQVRMWYQSDGINFAMATYTSVSPPESRELLEAEGIVRSMRFISSLVQ